MYHYTILISPLLQNEDPDSTNGLFVSQLGFRRLMTAVYMHTNLLIIAGPMAHYLAIKESRYRYSHTLQFVPLKVLGKILEGKQVSMHLSKVGDRRRLPYCRAMDYKYRPTEFEGMTPICYWRWIQVRMLRDAEQDDVEYFRFTEDHPKYDTHVCVYRERPVQVNIDWTFFGDTKNLIEPITQPPSHRRWYTTFRKDEDHCRNVLLAFSAYRTEEDLKPRGSYKRRLCELHEEGKLDEFKPMMQNLQVIRDSMDAGTMPKSTTSDAFDLEDIPEQDSGDEIDSTIQSEIAQFFTNSNNGRILDREPDEIHLKKSIFYLINTVFKFIDLL